MIPVLGQVFAMTAVVAEFLLITESAPAVLAGAAVILRSKRKRNHKDHNSGSGALLRRMEDRQQADRACGGAEAAQLQSLRLHGEGDSREAEAEP